MRELLKGAIDIHAHVGPSVTPRSVDVADMMKLAQDAGYRAIVAKDHYFPTMMSAEIAEKHAGDGTVKVFGGIVLNNSVGRFNIQAVELACRMGAKFVSMPTLSAKNHIDGHAGHNAVDEDPIFLLDKDGKLKDEVVRVIDYVAEKWPEVILSTGHGIPDEVDAVVTEAAKKGVKKILVNHPFFTVRASLEQTVKWSRLGAYIELTSSAFPKFVPVDVALDIINQVDTDLIVIDGDSGQRGTNPIDVMVRFLTLLVQDNGVSEEKINKMLKETPAKLLGI